VKRAGRADWWRPFVAMSNVRYRGIYKPFDQERKRVKKNMKRAEAVEFIDVRNHPRYYFADQMVTIRDRHDFVRKLTDGSYTDAVAFVTAKSFVPARQRRARHARDREHRNHRRRELRPRLPRHERDDGQILDDHHRWKTGETARDEHRVSWHRSSGRQTSRRDALSQHARRGRREDFAWRRRSPPRCGARAAAQNRNPMTITDPAERERKRRRHRNERIAAAILVLLVGGGTLAVMFWNRRVTKTSGLTGATSQDRCASHPK
jgi:hypothetical protein